jgi:hypothetical protein
MRRTTEDQTLERNYIQKYQFLIAEYELVKRKQHPRFKFVTDFYKAHNTSRQTFLKYYNLFVQINHSPYSLMPKKHGPKWKCKSFGDKAF